MKNKTCLVTGYGFVGRYLRRELMDLGADITVLDRNLEHITELQQECPEAKVIKKDLRHLDTQMEFDYVFHTAGSTHVGYGEINYLRVYEDNVLATLNLLKHVRANRRFVFTSSAVVYPNVNGLHAEDEQLKPSSVYGLSKIAGEQLIRHFSEKNNQDYTIFRSFNSYGEGQKGFFLIPQIIAQGKREGKITLWNRDSERDFIYISDIVRGLVTLPQQQDTKGETINLGTGKASSSGELGDLLGKLLGNLPVSEKGYHDPAALASVIADTRKAERLGFKARVGLEEGLRKTIEAQGCKM